MIRLEAIIAAAALFLDQHAQGDELLFLFAVAHQQLPRPSQPEGA